MTEIKPDLYSMTEEELLSYFLSIGEPKFRAKQVFSAIAQGTPISDITTLSKALRERLANETLDSLPRVRERLVSQIDGTVKYLFELHDGACIESVLMKYKHGNTLCISSQVGCRMGCKFCASTIGGRERDLMPSELLGQITVAQRDSGERISNVVMMGIGEPLDNFDVTVGVRFSTYAVPMIIGEIKRFLRDGNSLRVPRSIRDTAYQVLKAREVIEDRDEEATIENIAKELQVAEREVVYALDAISDPVSLYEPVYNKAGDALLLMDQLADEKNTDEIWTEHVALSEAMGKLGERERKILFLRYYEGKTQTEISEEVGISQAQVSRLEKTALKTIKRNIS